MNHAWNFDHIRREENKVVDLMENVGGVEETTLVKDNCRILKERIG